MKDTFPIGTYVELLPGRENVYADVPAGSRGWVRALDLDDDDFSKVFVEWDKEYWRYHGQEDLWTFSSHFKATEPSPDLVASAQLEAPHTGPCPDCGSYHEEEQRMESYIDAISEAFNSAAGSDGFFLINIRRERDPMSGVEMFVIDTSRGSMDPELNEIPMSEILRFVQEQKKMRGD